jgi:hypothetical protein
MKRELAPEWKPGVFSRDWSCVEWEEELQVRASLAACMACCGSWRALSRHHAPRRSAASPRKTGSTRRDTAVPVTRRERNSRRTEASPPEAVRVTRRTYFPSMQRRTAWAVWWSDSPGGLGHNPGDHWQAANPGATVYAGVGLFAAV